MRREGEKSPSLFLRLQIDHPVGTVQEGVIKRSSGCDHWEKFGVNKARMPPCSNPDINQDLGCDQSSPSPFHCHQNFFAIESIFVAIYIYIL